MSNVVAADAGGRAITTSTRFAGVIADPVRYSLSPALHNAAIRALGLDVVYGAFCVREGEVPHAVSGARSLGFVGLSVTMPHKQAAAKVADQYSTEVALLRVANTIYFRSGIAIAANTDGIGFIEDLTEEVGFDPSEKTCVVFGAGGAARAIVLALSDAGAREVVVLNRTRSRGESAAALSPRARVGIEDEVSAAELIVNATSQGMESKGEKEQLQVDAERVAGRIGRGQLVIDIVTRPLETPLLAAASRTGADTRNGLGMLVHQALHQFELIMGEKVHKDVMWNAIADESEGTIRSSQ